VVLSLVVVSFSFFKLCNILPKSTFSFSFFNSSKICTNVLKSFIASFLIAAVEAVDWAATSSARRALVAGPDWDLKPARAFYRQSAL
jgi:hypothetical protein